VLPSSKSQALTFVPTSTSSKRGQIAQLSWAVILGAKAVDGCIIDRDRVVACFICSIVAVTTAVYLRWTEMAASSPLPVTIQSQVKRRGFLATVTIRVVNCPAQVGCH
jgi:hypothetical protein